MDQNKDEIRKVIIGTNDAITLIRVKPKMAFQLERNDSRKS